MKRKMIRLARDGKWGGFLGQRVVEIPGDPCLGLVCQQARQRQRTEPAAAGLKHLPA